MQENTRIDDGMGELGLGIEGLLRRSARQLIQQAMFPKLGLGIEPVSGMAPGWSATSLWLGCR